MSLWLQPDDFAYRDLECINLSSLDYSLSNGRVIFQVVEIINRILNEALTEKKKLVLTVTALRSPLLKLRGILELDLLTQLVNL